MTVTSYNVIATGSHYGNAALISKNGWASSDRIVIAAENRPEKPSSSRMVPIHYDFRWPLPLQIQQTDNDGPQFQNLEPRCTTNETTAIRQLQRRLKDLGYGWDAIQFDWLPRYYGDAGYPSNDRPTLPLAIFTNHYMNSRINPNFGNWYLCLRYWPETHSTANGDPDNHTIHKSIGNEGTSYDFVSDNEKDLQKRLDSYPGELDGLWMGSPDGSIRYDGKYGSGPMKGVRLFNEMCGEGDAMDGAFVGEVTKRNLEAGLEVHGRYDIATKVSVYLWQYNQIHKKGNPFGIPAVTGIVDLPTMRSLEYDGLAPETDYFYTDKGSPDLFCAIPLAARYDCPLFFTAATGIDGSIKAEITRLGATKATIVGNTDAVPTNIEDELRALGCTIDRISGADYYEVAANVSKRFTNLQECIIINPNDFLNTLGLGAYAARAIAPILYSKVGAAPQMTVDAAARFAKSTIIGNKYYVGNDTKSRVPIPKRYSSPDRHRTSVYFNQFHSLFDFNWMFFTSDGGWTDDYCGCVLAAKRNAPMFNLHGDTTVKLPSIIAQRIAEEQPTKMTVIGYVTDDVMNTLLQDIANTGTYSLSDTRIVLQPHFNKRVFT